MGGKSFMDQNKAAIAMDYSIVLALDPGYLAVKVVLLVCGVQCRLTDIFMFCHLSFVIQCREKHTDICTVECPRKHHL